MKRRITRHRSELLAWIDWCATADEELLACSGRLARAYPPGCPLEGGEWRTAEGNLHAAFRSQDDEAWRDELAAYEHFALDYFAAFEKEHGHAQ